MLANKAEEMLFQQIGMSQTVISLANGYAIILQQNKIIHPRLHITFVHWVCMVKVRMDLKNFHSILWKSSLFSFSCGGEIGKKKVKTLNWTSAKGLCKEATLRIRVSSFWNLVSILFERNIREKWVEIGEYGLYCLRNQNLKAKKDHQRICFISTF